jgi:type VI secretion system protein ImpJ
MIVSQPLFWHPGIYLQPQHLQLLDRFSQGLSAPYQHYLVPGFWGMGAMKIIQEALGTRTFKLAAGEFLFPDGTFVCLPQNAVATTRVFDDAWLEGGKPVTVYLGLKKWNDDGVNVTTLSAMENIGSVHTRFVAMKEPEACPDLHGDGAGGLVKRMHFVLKIFWDNELPQLGDYELIPIARLERFGAEVRLADEFIPPCLTFSAADSLKRLVEEIRDQVSARANQLEEHKSRRGVQTAEFGSRDMVYFLALRSINRYVPLLFQYTQTGRVHPWHLYGVLRQLVGELSCFSEGVGVLGDAGREGSPLPDYDHGQLWKCFAAAQDMISHLLDDITAGPEYVMRLVHDGTYYAAALKPAIFEGRNRFYLAVRADADPKLILHALEHTAKLSSRESLDVLVTQALPGVPLQYLQVPPQELPRRANTLYFAIHHHDEQWETVAKNHSLALFWHNPPEDLTVELMVVGR